MNTRQAAIYLGVSVNVLHKLCHSGKVKFRWEKRKNYRQRIYELIELRRIKDQMTHLKFCKTCKKELGESERIYCSRDCAFPSPCIVCGKRLRRGKKTCSEECRSKLRHANTCKRCGKPCSISFCSPACGKAWHLKNKNNAVYSAFDTGHRERCNRCGQIKWTKGVCLACNARDYKERAKNERRLAGRKPS